jgi:hypothetical protein
VAPSDGEIILGRMLRVPADYSQRLHRLRVALLRLAETNDGVTVHRIGELCTPLRKG